MIPDLGESYTLVHSYDKNTISFYHQLDRSFFKYSDNSQIRSLLAPVNRNGPRNSDHIILSHLYIGFAIYNFDKVTRLLRNKFKTLVTLSLLDVP
jgi:hypothetical protein